MNYRCEFEFGLLFEISGGVSRKKLSRSAVSALDTMLQHLEAKDLALGTAALSCGCSCG